MYLEQYAMPENPKQTAGISIIQMNMLTYSIDTQPTMQQDELAMSAGLGSTLFNCAL